MGKNRTILLVIFIIFLSAQFFCQIENSDKRDQEELKHEVSVVLKLVQVYVTDKNGNPVTDLEKSDFVLYENGQLKTITAFEKHFLI